MIRYQGWLAFTALWVILISSYAKEEFFKNSTSIQTVKNSEGELYSTPSELHDQSNDGCVEVPGYSWNQVKSEVIKDANVGIFHAKPKIDQRFLQLNKSRVNNIKKVNGSIFSYLTTYKSRTVDVKSSSDGQLKKNIAIPVNKDHIKCSKLLLKASGISEQVLLQHTPNPKNKVERNIYKQNKLNNNIDTETRRNNRHLDIDRKWKNSKNGKGSETSITEKILIGNQLIKWNIPNDKKKKYIDKMRITNEGEKYSTVSSEKIKATYRKKNSQSTFTDKDKAKILMETSELTPKIQLNLFAKLLRVNPLIRLTNEKTQSYNQQLQVEPFLQPNRPHLTQKRITFTPITPLQKHHVQLKDVQRLLNNAFHENNKNKSVFIYLKNSPSRNSILEHQENVESYNKSVIKEEKKINNIFHDDIKNKGKYLSYKIMKAKKLNKIEKLRDAKKIMKNQQIKSRKILSNSMVRVRKDIGVSGMTSSAENRLDSVSRVIPLVYEVDSTEFNNTRGSSTATVLLNGNYNAILASRSRKLEATSRHDRNSTQVSNIQLLERMLSPAKSHFEGYYHLNVTDIEAISTDPPLQDLTSTSEITTMSENEEFILPTDLSKTITTGWNKRSFRNSPEESFESLVKPQQASGLSTSVLLEDIPRLEINTLKWSRDHATTQILETTPRTKIDRNLENVTFTLRDFTIALNNSNLYNMANNVNQLLDPLKRSGSLSERSKTEILKMEIELSSGSLDTGETTPKGNTYNDVKKSKLSTHSQIVGEKWEKIKPVWDVNDTETDVSSDIDSSSIALFTKLTNQISPPITGENGFTSNRDIRTSDHVDHENASLITLNQWPVKHSAVVEGNLVLGGLMMVHEREDTVTCGPIMPQGGIQALEAMLYTLDWLNKHEIVPGVKIGAHILDDCDKDTYGLEMAVDFIKGSISNIDGAEYNCNKSTVRKVISGVVGAASSVTSIQVANLLRLFRIPQVSFFSTSPELSNKQRFEYFTRTIPSDHYQVKAMVDIVRKMGWSYVSIIYEESNYGIKAYEELEELLAKNQICIAIKEKLVKDSGVAEETAYDNIVQKLLTKPRARGCIIFGSDQEVAGMMRAVRRNNATGAFYWIGSDGWSARGLVSNKNEPEVEGTLSVQPQANPVEGFEEYFLNLTVENNRRNPWFVEFWEDHFQCRYPTASRTPYNQKYKLLCTKMERLTKQNTAFEDQLQFVSDAVMAFAYAFRDMHADLCYGQPGLCDAMKPTKGTELLKYLRKVEFQGLSGDNFHFDKNGDGPARYNIIHFKQVSPGQYRWIRVGKYLEGELVLNMSEIQFRLDNPGPPESVCSLPCRVGQAKKYVEGESCCWHCLDCTQYQIRHATDQTRCIQCLEGTVPDETHSYCRDIPEEFLKFDSGWAIGAMSFSASGILVTLFVGGVFVKYNDTPIVRASGRELSYVLLTGILLCYLVTFTLILKPTDLVCGIQRFAAGFCFTVVYAALLTKTNRISRIFNKSKKSAKRPSFISPRSQLIICSMLVGVQILINAVWMVIDPAKARHHYPTREDNLLVCNSYIDASYMIAFTYPIILIIVCTVYAILTRKIPEDFNESKHIGFTMYTTCVIWLAFVPLYFGTGNHVALRITSMSVTISLSASVTIACLFSPKLYIILIHPERNIRRGRGPFAPKHSTVARTNASSMISTVTLTAVTCDQNKAVKGQTISTIDCSTQSELLEMEVKDCKNGKLPVTLTSRSTQTLANNNGKEANIPLSVSNDQSNTDPVESAKSLNNMKIGNGPINKNDITL